VAQLGGSGFFELVFELVAVFAPVGAFDPVLADGHGEIGNDCASTADPR
jgi:hypothetical protein